VPISLVAFDLDGTLVDSLRDLAESANALLVECGAQPLDEQAIGGMVGDGAATLVTRAFVAAGVPQPPDALGRFLAVYNARLVRWTRPYPGVPSLLAELSPRVSLAVLTNKPLEATRRILEGLDLASRFPFERVIGGDGPFPRKPDPSGLRWLAGSAGVSIDQTLLVGDSSVDWRTARAASARLCIARYGFGYRPEAREEPRPDDLAIDAPLDLLKAL